MSVLSLLLNLLWIVFGGLWMAIAWVVAAVIMAITIIGIPFAWAHLKLAGLALWPIGKMIVPADEMPWSYGQRRILGRHDDLADRPEREPGELQVRPGEGDADDGDGEQAGGGEMQQGEPPAGRSVRPPRQGDSRTGRTSGSRHR